MRSFGGLGYLLMIVAVAVAIDRMAVSLVDAMATHGNDAIFSGHESGQAPATAAPGTDCTKPPLAGPAPTPAGTHPCPAAAAGTSGPVKRLTDIWAALRRL